MTREQAIEAVKKTILERFPDLKIIETFDKESGETFISISNAETYYSDDFRRIAAMLETELLWPSGLFDFYFVTSGSIPESKKNEIRAEVSDSPA